MIAVVTSWAIYCVLLVVDVRRIFGQVLWPRDVAKAVGLAVVAFLVGLAVRTILGGRLGDPLAGLVFAGIFLAGVTLGAIVVGQWVARGLGTLAEERVTILAATLRTGAVATPNPSEMARADDCPPANDPVAPLCGAANVTKAPGSARPLASRTVAERATGNKVPACVPCGVPSRANSDAGGFAIDVLSSTVTLLLLRLATRRSRTPLPRRDADSTAIGPEPVPTLIGAWKPPEPFPSSTAILLPKMLPVARSSNPSPLKSPIAKPLGVKLSAMLLTVGNVPSFRPSMIEMPKALTTARSRRPLPRMSTARNM